MIFMEDSAPSCYLFRSQSVIILCLPWLVTITLETASGILIPAAKNVRPITESGIFKVSPAREEHHFIPITSSYRKRFGTSHITQNEVKVTNSSH
jgi:hypothetical protein